MESDHDEIGPDWIAPDGTNPMERTRWTGPDGPDPTESDPTQSGPDLDQAFFAYPAHQPFALTALPGNSAQAPHGAAAPW